MRSKVGWAGDLDYLVECVLNDGVGESGRDVCDGCALLLCLLDVGVHEYGTTRSKVGRILCKECGLCEINHAVIQGLCKCLDERATARGAGLVQLHAVDGAVLDLDALHVLTADVEDAVYIRLKECSRIVVGDRLDLALVEHECGF